MLYFVLHYILIVSHCVHTCHLAPVLTFYIVPGILLLVFVSHPIAKPKCAWLKYNIMHIMT